SGQRGSNTWPLCVPTPPPPGRFAPALSFFPLAAHGLQRRDDLADLRPPRARLRGLPARSASRVRCQVNADEPSAFLTKREATTLGGRAFVPTQCAALAVSSPRTR